MKKQIIQSWLLFSLFVGLFSIVKAQLLVEDSIRLMPYYFTLNDVEKGVDSLMKYSLDYKELHHYSKTNYNKMGELDLGLPSTPSLNLSKTESEKEFGFNSGLANEGLDFIANKDVKHFLAFTPIADFNFAQGTQGLVSLRGFFTKNFGDRSNIAIGINNLQSDMWNDNLKLVNKNFWVSSYHLSKSNKYAVSIKLLWNRLKFNETGGLHDSINIFGKPNADLRALPFELVGPLTRINITEHVVSQYFTPLSKHGIISDKWNKVAIKSPLYFSHQFVFKREIHQYKDFAPRTTYYPKIIINNSLTEDSVQFRTVGNAVYLHLNQRKKGKYAMGLKTGVGADIIRNSGRFYSIQNFVNTYLASVLNMDFKEYSLNGNGKLYFTGYNAGDWQLKSNIQWKKSIQLKAFFNIKNIMPDFKFNNLKSNHVWLDNSFKNKSNILYAGIIAKREKKFAVSISQKIMRNYYYFDNNFTAQILNKTILIPRVKAEYFLKLKNIQIDITAQYQSSSNPVLPMPTWLLFSRISYNRMVFKNKMDFNTGLELTYFSKFNAPVYSPFMHQYVLTNSPSEVGNYPVASYYISGKVKTFRYFVKIDHLNYPILGYRINPKVFNNRSYASYGYPLQTRRIRLGVSWAFFN